MIHARKDYDRIQDPEGKIGDAELWQQKNGCKVADL